MDRVKSAANELGASYYRAWNNAPDKATLMRRNGEWIKRVAKEGHVIIDIGIDKARTVRSDFYKMEKEILEQLHIPA